MSGGEGKGVMEGQALTPPPMAASMSAMRGASGEGLRWEPAERQSEFLKRGEYEVLFGGAKFGGKTDAALAWIILRREKYPGSKGLFIRRELTEVTKEGAAWDRIQQILGKGVRYNQADHKVEFPNGSVEEFGHCKNEDDKFHYQGAQYDDIFFDQVEQFTESQYTYIKGACRTALKNPPRSREGAAIEPRVRCSANPGDIGHAWVKAYYVDVAAPGEVYTYRSKVELPEGGEVELERSRVYIPSSVFDSVRGGVVSADYILTLEAMPEPYRSAYLYGKWDVFVGQAFVDFMPMKDGKPYHVVPFEVLPPEWRRISVHDWGYEEPCYTIWGAIDPVGGVIWYRELWGRNWDPEEIATQNLLAQGGEVVSQAYADPSIWATYRARLTRSQVDSLEEKGELQLSIADQYRKVGWHLQPANNDRLAGKAAIHRLLKQRPDGVPYMRFMDSCPRAIATFQQIQLDPKRAEDVVTTYSPDAVLRDEPYDCVRYGAMALRTVTMPYGDLVSTRNYTGGFR